MSSEADIERGLIHTKNKNIIHGHDDHLLSFTSADDDGWQPPTEAEMKVLQAKRERSDKISKLMGDYLLKGYRMLGVCCPVCDTILLQDKQGSNYCVACQELDADNVKDDPALNDQAALRQAAEHSQRLTAGSSNQDWSTEPSTSGIDTRAEGAVAITGDEMTRGRQSQMTFGPPDLTRDTPQRFMSAHCKFPTQESVGGARVRTKVPCSNEIQIGQPDLDQVRKKALFVLYKKLQETSEELVKSTNVNSNISLCQLIKHCSEAIEALHRF